ncbi:helix-turn-helix transcriptional regulator [Enterobacter sp.]|uniref:helix-turn-helix domain-containing protein n=1 Tax=Enterobacter sp. TaxID=42895 RepID=UPI00296E8C5F|nr:helix-turn-helix transcriptional regulator [Enterobacter sp.]
MNSEYFIRLALDNLKCSQKELASRLGVSSTQISKWKKGEHMSQEMENRFREITQIGTYSPQLVEWSGSTENAKKWDQLIHYLADRAHENAETGYITVPLNDEEGYLCIETIDVLKQIGLKSPKSFPKELDINEYASQEEAAEHLWEAIESNVYSSIIDQIFHSLNDVYGFYAAYVDELIEDEELDIYSTNAINIRECLLPLAACKIDTDLTQVPKFNEFRYKVEKDYENWLNELKLKAFRAGIPLRAELLQLVYDTADSLSVAAEAESLEFNKNRIHPDIYMNELLTGMRIIHQVLPEIIKKLDITDFKLDTSELNAGR